MNHFIVIKHYVPANKVSFKESKGTGYFFRFQTVTNVEEQDNQGRNTYMY